MEKFKKLSVRASLISVLAIANIGIIVSYARIKLLMEVTHENRIFSIRIMVPIC